MSVVHVRHIKSQLEKLFTGKIDMSDIPENRPDAERENCFLSRALAAYALSQVAEIEPEQAAEAITDGYDDNGIDAIYFAPADRILYVVQSKWTHSGKGSPESGDVKKFIDGFKDLTEGKFERFNKRVQDRKEEILSALDDARIKFNLVVVHTGNEGLSNHAARDFEDLLKEMNDPIEAATLTVLSQAEVHRFVSGLAEGDPINIEVALYDWGQVREPFLAYYGQVEAAEIATWAEKYGSKLFTRNLRKFLDSTEVNQAIAKTLADAPVNLWYFNNGITVLCNRLQKKPLGGTDRTTGFFECDGISVVNGAQTVGSIREAVAKNPEAVKSARVLVRFISLEHCPEGFASEVTRATNTQNRIERRDFAALDPQQHRLKTELFFDNRKEYAYKSGDPAPKPEDGCSIDEATVALACAQPDVGLAVQAKREIGRLWEDIDKAPYKLLFSAATSAMRLWRSVEILRIVEDQLKAAVKPLAGRERGVLVHGNRFLLHRVFRRLPTSQLDSTTLDMDAVKASVATILKEEIAKTGAAIDALFPPTSYLSNLFKNAAKCKQISAHIEKEDVEKSKPLTLPL